MRIDPLLTRSPVTGAVRHVTDDLLSEVYLAPRNAGLTLADHLGPGAPWSDGFAAAPEETAQAVEAGLISVARATSGLDPADLAPERLPLGRARTHLTALRDPWDRLGALPGPLDTWRHVLRSPAAVALEPLPLIGADCPFADVAETALAKTLRAHHGDVDTDPHGPLAANEKAFLHLQDHLGRQFGTKTPDGSVTCYGLRDPHEEAEFAAARARAMLDDGTADHPGEIGLLVRDTTAYALALPEAFDRVGLPLSGLPVKPAHRDGAGELLSLLLVLLGGPAPRTAFASLLVSPSMPWPLETGLQMARDVIDRGWSRTASDREGPAREVLDNLRPCSTPEQLFARLGVVARAVPEAGLHPRIAALKAVTADSIDWPLLRRLAAPRPIASEGHDRFVEGVSLFTETALPWRPARQLIVLGMAGRHWPRLPGSDPFFTEAEIAAIRDTGLLLHGRRQKLARGLELFRRQLGAATEGLTLLVPALDLRGDRLMPSTGLALIAHMLGAKEPADLVRDLRSTSPEDWPVAAHRPAPVPSGGAPDLPRDGQIHIQRGLGTPDRPGVDLLRLRETPECQPLPHSPSRLETLLVSPLGWLLDELGATDLSWAPETLDVMTLGTLMHKVLENVFLEGAPIPDDASLDATVPAVLDSVIQLYAPWLTDAAWTKKRRSLLQEAREICTSWVGFLRETGAEILHNEFDLAGDHGDLPLHGNPVQFALLWQLARGARRALIVGVTKQSIIGFQGADPRLSEALQVAHPEAVKPLDRNWRSEARIMEMVNTLGPSLFDSYDPLAPQRGATGETTLEIMHLPGGRKDTSAECIANRVADILDAGTLVHDTASGEMRPARPGDIAVLTYTHDKASAAAAALGDHGLPVRIQQDGWLTSPAMRAARAALAIASDPDDLNASLTWLTLGPPRMGLEDALRNTIDGVLSTHVALAPLRALNDGLESRPVAETLAAVLNAGGLRDWAGGLAQPAQALADLARFEAEAQEFDAMALDLRAAAGFHGAGPQVFLGWILHQFAKEWDRHPDPDGWSSSGIEICIWHAAKGREWPITVVAGLEKTINEHPGTLRADFDGFDDIDNALEHAGLGFLPDFAAPESQEPFTEARRPEDERDAARKLYVALTRARDRLIMVLPRERSRPRDNAERMVDLLRDRAGFETDGDTLTVDGHRFDARVAEGLSDAPSGPAAGTGETHPRFGRAQALSDAPRSPWRRRPSSQAEPVPSGAAPPETVKLAEAVAETRTGSAAERGSAWHLAFRVLGERPDLSDRIRAATGLPESAITQIAMQAQVLTRWLADRGYDRLHFELPLQKIDADGSQTNAILDCLAEGPDGLLIVDHKSGPCPDPDARFATYQPQLDTYAAMVRAEWPDKPVDGVAIHWMSEGTLSIAHSTTRELA
ncbi:PD-(D/E)XK nuclease family protein [Chachezhania antarctica]|uniref:PD-(D/E)XK nuclease family protein n=1 Tax=Chachezhania antarctica TaxID=2340860 RepID=UPI001F08E3C0|nr:PD-(D/E)XK nuclease family protein [Chachezhania antarctica]